MLGDHDVILQDFVLPSSDDANGEELLRGEGDALNGIVHDEFGAVRRRGSLIWWKQRIRERSEVQGRAHGGGALLLGRASIFLRVSGRADPCCGEYRFRRPLVCREC